MKVLLPLCRTGRVPGRSMQRSAGAAALCATTARFFAVLAVLLLWPVETVWAQAIDGNLRRSMGNLRPPSPQTGLQRSAPADSGSTVGTPLPEGHQGHSGVAPWHHHGCHSPYPIWGWPPGYYWTPHFYVAPLYLPAELLYGPQATARFLGIPQFQLARRSEPRYVVVVQPPPEKPEPKAPPNALPIQPEPNDRVEEVARRFIGFGDAHFAAQRFAEAYQRYKRAAQTAPKLADALFRQGFALVALGNFQQAAQVWKKGMEIAPEWPRAAFRLEELYAGIPQAKAGHLDAVINAATRNPDDADLLFAAGVALYFDGQKDQARVFFEEALLTAQPITRYVDPFLKAIPQQQAAPEPELVLP